MLIRFTLKNFLSFKNETEFNLFPSRTQRLEHHKVQGGGFEFLRYSALYGTNGSGKSNLIKAIALLQNLVLGGKLPLGMDTLKFKLIKEQLSEPTSLAIEFIENYKPYYYTITFDKDAILYEYLAESNKEEDILVFERSLEDDVQTIKFHEGYYKSDKESLFAEVLSEKLILKNELVITFLNNKYPDEFELVCRAFNWFDNTLVVIKPDAKPGGIAHILDKTPDVKDFANRFITKLNTGISEVGIEKKKFDEFFNTPGDKGVKGKIVEELKDDPSKFSVLTHSETGEEVSLVYENNDLVTKRLITKHKNFKGESVDFNLGEESDGTKRLIDYVPAFQGIIYDTKVFVIDEIERSIHPITIKKIISKLSLNENVKGQLIFSTHESNLLDQKIFRPDEIWFAEKDLEGASQLYSLSDFQVHHTINIENGYLKGRFGGVPFLGNLKDLNW